MSGNDFQGWRDPKNDEAALAVAKGIRDTDPDHLQTVELNYEVSGSLDDPKWEPVISIMRLHLLSDLRPGAQGITTGPISCP